MNILIADDNETNLKLLRVVLEAEGHEAIMAANGVEALEILNQRPVDLIISDILMPKMDGYRLCYEVRASGRFDLTPFIFYTSTYTSPVDEKLAVELGSDKFLRKPASTSEILSAIHEVTRKPRTAATCPVSLPSELDLMKDYSQQLVAKLEQKNAELQELTDELVKAQNQLQRFLAESPSVIYSLRVDGADLRLVWVSANILQMVGFTADEVTAPGWWSKNIHPDDIARAMASFELAIQESQSSDEYRFLRKDGEICWIRDERRVLRESEAGPAEVIGSWADVTERRLLEDQLRQSQKMEAIGQLAGGVAHDFNNILTVILGYAEILMENLAVDDPRHEYCEIIKDAGMHASTLTQRLLAFGRKQTLQPQVLDLNRVAVDLEKMLPRLIGEDIEVKTAPDPELGAVIADRGQVEQIILNLAINARDAMPGGGVLSMETCNVKLDEEYAKMHAEVTPGSYALLAITDTGIGIPRDIQQRIFEPFFTTKEPGKGTGLGLATVYGIVKQSGGHIAVYSEVGHGTVFKVYLPHADPNASAALDAAEAVAPMSGSETILIAEDDDSLREMARRILEGGGYTVLEARSGVEALHVTEAYARPIHLLFTDVVMPGMTGAELAGIVMQEHPKTRVLFASGHTLDAIARHGVLDPGITFLQKPFTPHALLRRVRDVLDAPPV